MATVEAIPGWLLLVASSQIRFNEERTPKDDEPRLKGTSSKVYLEVRKAGIKLFLRFLNERYGRNAVSSFMLGDLTMHDV